MWLDIESFVKLGVMAAPSVMIDGKLVYSRKSRLPSYIEMQMLRLYQPVILLLDEYDVPVAKASNHDI
ncbi:MAG: hypothetical protein V8R41_07530 [Dorea formicigenerans]